MTKRSYYTTPGLVVVCLTTLFLLVVTYNSRSYIQRTHSNAALESIRYSNHTLVELYNLDLVRSSHIETPESVRAIYISSWVFGTPSLRNRLINFVEASDINAVVIDIKDSTGVISYNIDHPVVDTIGADSTRVVGMRELIQNLHDKNIYVIGRLTTFQDPIAAIKKDWTFKRVDNGTPWKDRKGLSFIDPSNQDAWDYIADIAEIAYRDGFDEINFDYIRFPSDGDISNIAYNLPKEDTKVSVMKDFYEYIGQRLRSQGIPISADIFGLVTTQTEDIGIGQDLEDVLVHFDAVAPMVYPSHYRSGFFGLSNPNADPYTVIQQSMQSAIDRSEMLRLENPDITIAELRPWIQDFSLGTPSYGHTEVRAQLEATRDIGLDSYMVWDA